jgi:hypothetical protein
MDMFRSTVTDTAESDRDKGALVDVIPLSHLELDLAAPVEGWTVFLAARGIEVTLDDIGRMAIARVDARQLLTEKREREAEQARRRKLAEARAVADDQIRRARIWGGAPAVEGVSAAALMLQADKDAQPKRRSVLQEALAGSETLTYHPLPKSDEAS